MKKMKKIETKRGMKNISLHFLDIFILQRTIREMLMEQFISNENKNPLSACFSFLLNVRACMCVGICVCMCVGRWVCAHMRGWACACVFECVHVGASLFFCTLELSFSFSFLSFLSISLALSLNTCVFVSLIRFCFNPQHYIAVCIFL